MRIIIAAVLVALFAAVMAAESDRFIEKWINKGKAIVPDVKEIWNSGKNIAKEGRNIIDAGKRIRNKIREESDAEFFKKIAKFAKKVAPIVKKGIQIYGKVKSAGILADSESDAEFLSKIKKWWDTKGKNLFNKAKEYYAKGKQIYDIVKSKKAETESDAEFLSKIKKWWDTKGKNLFNKAKEYYAKGKQIYDIVKSKKAETESDAEFLSKIKKWWDTKGKNLFNKAKEYYAKGKQIYDIVKPKKTAETESDLFIGALAGMALKKLAAKKIGGLIQKKLSKKGKSKKAQTESDAEFFKKIAKFAKKVAPIVKKGIQIYGKVKSAGILSDSDAEFFSKMKKWWDTKGKNLFNKAKEYYAKGKQIYDIVKSKKAEAEADTDATFDCGMAYQSGSALGVKQCVNVQGKPVVVATAVAFEKLNAAAAAAGIKLQVNSGFRTQKEQEYLYNCYKTKKCNNGNLAARPGYSNHQNGLAMDISCSNPKVFDWMRNNASKFGFVRTVASENWHWELRNSKCDAFVKYSCK